jgi:hypothetical protein
MSATLDALVDSVVVAEKANQENSSSNSNNDAANVDQDKAAAVEHSCRCVVAAAHRRVYFLIHRHWCVIVRRTKQSWIGSWKSRNTMRTRHWMHRFLRSAAAAG